jgi:hypothetical protein
MNLALFSVLVMALSGPASAEAKSNRTEPTFVSRYAKLSQCSDVEHAPENEDWVYFRCDGYGRIPAWYVCTDSVRCKFGFGVKPNVSGLFGTDWKDWPLEWRGRERQGSFEPVSVIIRRTPYPESRSKLYVYRLRSDGISCIVGEATTNAGARVIADRAASAVSCEEEPELL